MIDAAFSVNNNDKARNRSAQGSFIAESEFPLTIYSRKNTAKTNGTAAKYSRLSS